MGQLILDYWNLEFGIWNLEFGIWNLEFGIWICDRSAGESTNFPANTVRISKKWKNIVGVSLIFTRTVFTFPLS